MSFNELNSRIDKNQASLKEQGRLDEDPSKALDAFQTSLNNPDIPEKLKEAQLTRLNRLLDSETQDALADLDRDLSDYLDRFKESLQVFENESLQKVEAGATLGGFVKEKLGVSWNHNPALFFTGVKVLQEYRIQHGSQLQVNADGGFTWNQGSASPDILEPGEYLDLSVLNNLSPQTDAIDFYLQNTTQPQRKAAIERIKRMLTEQAAVPELAGRAEEGATGAEAVQREIEASIGEGAGGAGFEDGDASTELPGVVTPAMAEELAALKTQQALDLKAAHNSYVSESEDSKNYPDSENIGYLPYLEAALVAARDDNEWTWDSQAEADAEKAELEKVSTAVSANLDKAQAALDACSPELNPTDYDALRKLFVENSKRYTELLASVDENLENVELRNLDKTIEQAEKTLAYMSTEETVEWTRSIMAQIDQNDWKSEGLSAIYGRLTDTLKAAVEAKLDADRQNMEAHSENTQAVSAYFNNTMTLARLFSDRGMDIDSGLTDASFAVRMAKEAFDFNNLALRFAEKETGKMPVKSYIEEALPVVLAKINALPVAGDLQILELKANLQRPTNSVTGLVQVYHCLRSVEAQLNGDNLDPKVCETELHNGLGQPMELAMAQFGDFLNGNLFGGQNVENINAAIGEPKLSFQQVEAWGLLADMEGYGYGLSDESWEYVAAGAKIAGMIAAGIAVGVATGGLGLVGAAVAGGTAMTAIGVVAEGRGFDDFTDAGVTYGKDLTINATTMGAARYLAAGRMVFQLSRAGTLAEKGGAAAILKMAGQKGGSLALNGLDDAATLGTRLTGATVEGSADVLTGASLDTLVKGGEFTDNLVQNAMFFGLSYAEFAGPGLKTLKGMSAEKLQSIRQLSSSISLERFKIDTLLKGSKWTAEALCTQLKKLDPREHLSFIATEFRTLASKVRAELADRMVRLMEQGEELEESLDPRLSRPSLADEFNAISSKPGQLDGTLAVLRESWFTVEHKELIGGRTFYFGPVTQAPNSYLECLAFVEIENVLYPRTFYKSQSSGGWRMALSRFPRNIYSKGKGIHYTQETRPVEQIVQYLDTQMSSVISIATDASLMVNDMDIFVANTHRYAAEIQEVDIGVGGSFFEKNMNMNWLRLAPAELRKQLSDINYPNGFVPSFNLGYSYHYIKNHTILGSCDIFVYEGVLDGRAVEWHMARDQANRVWIEAINYKDSPISSFGVRSEVINSGVLTQKPIEYRDQSNGEVGVDWILLEEPGFSGYLDQTPLLNNLVPIRTFRAAASAGLLKPSP